MMFEIKLNNEVMHSDQLQVFLQDRTNRSEVDALSHDANNDDQRIIICVCVMQTVIKTRHGHDKSLITAPGKDDLTIYK